ncbi:MAG: chemotaxis protein CheW [Chloroflexi bacterium]|nr:chemotaxis protein CheW [Chloroflexota bacterium]MDA1173545.1 chemotaxis protein CheW [Chloroflexota bacterium]
MAEAIATKGNAARDELQIVIFDLAGETYGADIQAVQAIVRMQQITRIPQAPPAVEGVINLRGKVNPVMDLRKRFGLNATEETKDSRIVIVNIGDQDVGLIVDAVAEVTRIPLDSIEPPSDVVSTVETDYISGIAKFEDRMIILLDLDKVLAGTQVDRG